MVKKSTFRTFCLVVGFFGIVFLIVSNSSTPVKVLGILFSLIFIGFGYAVTGKWSKYIIGEEQETGHKGSFGG